MLKWRKLMLAALRSLSRNKMRGLLTVLGVVIGVASVVALVSLGQGSQNDVKKQISSLGTNLIMVRSGSTQAGGVSGGMGSMSNLRLKDVQMLRDNASHVRFVSPEVRIQAQAVVGANNWSTSVIGVAPEYAQIKNYSVTSGRLFTDQDVTARRKVVLLGKTVVQELFNGNDPVGESIRLGNVPFQVIGVLSEKGQGGMGDDQDDLVLAPYSTVLYRLSDGVTLRSIVASAASDQQMEQAKQEITEILRSSHRLSDDADDDFHIMDQTEITAMATSITGTLTMLLSSVAGISLLVGGIGIMNIMLVSVTERTREIGIRLAIGARPGDVLIQFLIEAALLSCIGGVIGVLAGLGIAYALGSVTGTSVVMDPQMIMVAFAFSAAVGVFFGFYPARKAANLNPIDALRHE